LKIYIKDLPEQANAILACWKFPNFIWI